MHVDARPLSTFSTGATEIRLDPDGLQLTSATSRVSVDFSFPVLGRPAFPQQSGPQGSGPQGSGAAVQVLGRSAITATGEAVSEIAGIVVEALRGRVGLRPVGGGEVVALLAQPVSRDEAETVGFALRVDDGAWRVVAPHAVYHRSGWSDFGLAHITDTHVARRIDRFREALIRWG